MTMDSLDPMDEIRASFFIECEELLESLQEAIEFIENGNSDEETINVVFRAVHTIKGGAGAFGLKPLVEFAHCFETAMDFVRSGKVQITPEIIKLSYRCADHLSDLVISCRENTSAPITIGNELVSELESITGENLKHGDDEDQPIDFAPTPLDLSAAPLSFDLPELVLDDKAYTVEFAPHFELYESGNEPFIILRALRELGNCEITCHLNKIPMLEKLDPEIPLVSWTIELKSAAQAAEIMSIFEFVDGLCELTVSHRFPEEIAGIQVTEHTEPAEGAEDFALPKTTKDESQATPAKRQAPPKSVVRVDLDRLERLANLVGELVVNQAMLSQGLGEAGLSPHSEALVSLEEFGRLTRDIQDSVMMIRAQPVKPLFQRMSRIVREAAAGIGKEVQLIAIGETTEIDKTVIERLADPLTHMIRNAVDHGIESSQERVDAGKPCKGSVTLSASHKSGRVLLEVSDDGAGINRMRVKETAIKKGLIEPNIDLSETEIDNLLFLPGFSTASTVSDLSGRGVGMDVVRNAIQSLGGRVSISSVEGVGTKFSISLPLTLAVLDGMIVKIDSETLVLPLNFVSETLTLSSENLSHASPSAQVVRLRDEYIPIYDLGVALGYRSEKDSYVDAVAIVIENEEKKQSALIVDDIQDQRQVVIKGLDESLNRASGVAAATILGDGNIALIIDPADIVASAQNSNRSMR